MTQCSLEWRRIQRKIEGPHVGPSSSPESPAGEEDGGLAHEDALVEGQEKEALRLLDMAALTGGPPPAACGCCRNTAAPDLAAVGSAATVSALEPEL